MFTDFANVGFSLSQVVEPVVAKIWTSAVGMPPLAGVCGTHADVVAFHTGTCPFVAELC
jgi:hypothetical protein